MEPIKFKEANHILAKDQPQYKPLPVFISEQPSGEVVSCWRLSWKERLGILFTGKLWAASMTFHKPLQPLFFTTKKSDLLTTSSEPKQNG